MYTNDLLEEKYKAQRILSEKSHLCGKEYFFIIEQEIRELYKALGWQVKFSDRKGGWIKPLSFSDEKEKN